MKVKTKKKKTKKGVKKGNPQWPKGTSGNPKGRPKGAKNSINLNELKEAIKLVESREKRIPLLEYFVERAYVSDMILVALMSKLLPSLRAVEGLMFQASDISEEQAKDARDRMANRFNEKIEDIES